MKENRFELTDEVYKAIDWIQKEFNDGKPMSREEVYSCIMAAGVHSILDMMGMPTNMKEWETINTSKDTEMYGR